MHLLNHQTPCTRCECRIATQIWRGKAVCAICAQIERNKLKKVRV
jgi:hypothetical protein